MDSFDKKINELYNQPQQVVPSDLSWDQMEEGIYSRMEDDKPRRAAIWYWITGGVMLIAIAVAFIMIFDSNKNTPTVVNNDTTVQKINSDNPKTTIESNSSTQNIAYRKSTTNATENLTVIKNNDSAEKTNVNNKNLKHNTVNKQTKKSVDPFDAIDNQTTNSDNIANSNITHELNLPTNVKNYSNPIATKKINQYTNQNKTKTTINLDQLPVIGLNSIVNERPTIVANSTKKYTVEKPSDIKDKPNTKYSLSLLGGTTLHSGYQIGAGDQQYHSSLPGYHVSLGLESEKENGWGYQLGLSHSLLVERFDLDLVDTISAVKNAIVQSITNNITGNVTHIHADIDVLSSRDRRELSYNTINTLSFDAAVFKRITLGNRWSIAPSLGVQYSRIINIEGKTLNESGDIVSYDNNAAAINKNIYSVKIGLRLDYKLTNKISLKTEINQSISANRLYSNGSRLGITNIGGGLSYHF